MASELLRQYVKMVEFLGYTLGPSYEIALYDLTERDKSIIAIANGHVSGREVGAPLNHGALSVLRDKSYENEDYRVNCYGVSVNGKDLRSSTFYIKEGGKLVGMLCINFDDSGYRAISSQLMSLCHPDIFVDDMVRKAERAVWEAGGHPAEERFPATADAVAAGAIGRELERLGVTAERLTPEERLQIIANLEAGGTFLMKGAVKDVAAGLHCSQASIYRYLNQLKSEKTEHS